MPFAIKILRFGELYREISAFLEFDGGHLEFRNGHHLLNLSLCHN